MEEADGADRHAAVWLGGQDAPIDVHGVRRVVRVPVTPQLGIFREQAFVLDVRAVLFRPAAHARALHGADRNVRPPVPGVQQLHGSGGDVGMRRTDRGQNLALAPVGERVQHGHRAHVVVVADHVGVKDDPHRFRRFRRVGCRPHMVEQGSVAGNGRGEASGEHAQVLLRPNVAHHAGRGQAERLEVGGDLAFLPCAVEESDRPRAVRERTQPHVVVWRVHDRTPRLAERVLVDVQHLVVRQERTREGIEPLQVAADEERRGHDGPERHVRILLVRREAARGEAVRAHRPDHEHVRIVPAAGTGGVRHIHVLVDGAD